MKNNTELLTISRELEQTSVVQRINDGYINATQICKAANKVFYNYERLHTTKEYLDYLSFESGIPYSELIQVKKGGNYKEQGTWVHPKVAINLSQWASPKFAVMVSNWVFDWMSGKTPQKPKLAYHLQRYLLNRSKIPHTHFSVFNEIVLNLIAPLEDYGYELPDNLLPDISEGRMFANWVRREMGLEPNDFPTYSHTYPDGRTIPNIKLYPNNLLPAFRDHFHNVWLKERASDYFKERDTKALTYLQNVIKGLPSSGNQLKLIS
jgi:hypothetical protein